MRTKSIFVFVMVFVFLFSVSSWSMEKQGIDNLISELDEEYSQTRVHVYDPIEPVNRLIFKLNDKLYFYVFKPVAKGYSQVVPKNFREGISRWFFNVKYPIRAVNDILEFDFVSFFKDTGKFILNTAFGFGGLLDVTSNIKSLSSTPYVDGGITLGKWGIGHGVYLVLPVIGPTTLRDGIGDVGDYFLNPISYVEPPYVSAVIKGEDKLNYLSFHVGEYEDIKSSAIDPYIAFKNAYIQHRNSLLSR